MLSYEKGVVGTEDCGVVFELGLYTGEVGDINSKQNLFVKLGLIKDPLNNFLSTFAIIKAQFIGIQLLEIRDNTIDIKLNGDRILLNILG